MSKFKTRVEILAGSEFIAYLERLKSGTYEVDGVNRSLGRLSENTDTLLDDLHRIRTPAMFHFTGSMTMTAGTWAWSGVLTINLVSQLNAIYSNTIASGSKVIATGEVAYLIVDRTSVAAWTDANIVVAALATFLTALAGAEDRTDYIPLAVGVGADIVLMDGQWLRDGYSLTNAGATDTQYGQQTEVTLVHENQKDNLNLQLTGGGDIFWDDTVDGLTFGDSLFIEFPSSAGGDNYIAAGVYTIAVEQVMYVELLRDPGSSTNRTGNVVIVDLSVGVPDTDNVFVIAIHKSDGRVYLADGSALSHGETIALGGVRTGVQWHYQEAGTGLQPLNLTGSRPYKVGTGELMIYRNGIKSTASKETWSGGTFPGTGAMTGAVSVGDDYVEEDPGTGTGTRILWLRDNTGDTVGHATGTHDPAQTWPGATAVIVAFVGVQGQRPTVTIPDQIAGFEVVWTVDADTVRTGGGTLVSLGEKYINDGSAPIDALTTDASYEGPLVSTLTDSWVYLYLAPTATVGNSPTLVVSTAAPDDSAGGSGIHPAEIGYRFLTSAYITTGGKFNSFTKDGTWVSLGGDPVKGAGSGPEVTSNFSGKVTGVFATVDISANLPSTALGRAQLHIFVETDALVAAGAAVKLDVKSPWQGFADRSYREIKASNLDEVTYLVDPLCHDGTFHARFENPSVHTTVIYAVILGYSEGRATSGDTLE